MTTRIPNTPEAGAPPAPPARSDGQPYQMEMIYGGGRWRGYADTAEELTGLLIDGYSEHGDDAAQLHARISYAVGAHVPLQADVAAGEDLAACTKEERAILLGTRDNPPAVTEWAAPVPLVLVSSFYQPDGPLTRPAPAAGSEIIWIDPRTSESLLASLTAAGWISLARRDDSPAGGPDAAG